MKVVMFLMNVIFILMNNQISSITISKQAKNIKNINEYINRHLSAPSTHLLDVSDILDNRDVL
jgi:hypothetical protein